MIQKRPIKTAFIYLLVSMFCALFGAVYEHFSHGVFSAHMIYAFAFPLVGGTFPYMIFGFAGLQKLPGTAVQNFYHTGIATLTVGSIVRGVLDIYGTSNPLDIIYFAAGSLLTAVGIICYIVQIILSRTPKKID